MRLQAGLLLLASWIFPAGAIFADEVDHIDFHLALLGVPLAHSTFFIKPASSSGASLLYTLSEKSILGAVNPKDGSVVWRQNLTRSIAASPCHRDTTAPAGVLRGSDGSAIVVSAAGTSASAWSAVDGKLVWEAGFEDECAVALELLEMDDGAAAAPASTMKDSIALFTRRERTAAVRRLDGASGDVKWEYKDDSGDVPLQLSSSSTEIFYVSLQSALLKGYKIKVTALDPLTGRQTQQYVLNSENDIADPESVLFVGSNSASPLIVWADKSRKTLKINLLGSKQVTAVTIDNSSGEEIRSITVHAPRQLHSLSHFLVHYETDSISWADVYHADLKSSSVTRAYHLPRVEERSAFATSHIDANVYFTRITESELTVVSSMSHGVLGRWALSRSWPPTDRILHAVSEVVAKGDSVAVRSAPVFGSGDWCLIRNGHVEWSRPEALAGAVAATWAETDDHESLAHELEIEGHESVSAAYLHRVRRHLRDLQHLPEWLRQLPMRILSSMTADEISNLDSFGIYKPVILATDSGRLVALDTGKHGSVIWSVQAVVAAELDGKWNVKAISTQPGSVSVYADDGSSVTVNVTSGAVISRTAKTTTGLGAVAVLNSNAALPPAVVAIKKDGTPLDDSAVADDKSGILVTTSEDGRLLGWRPGNSQAPAWAFTPPPGQKMIRVISRPAHDPVASIGRVLSDRSVLYKYLNPNLAFVIAVDGEDSSSSNSNGHNSATFYLLDAVSGRVLYSSVQRGVNPALPIASAMSENWIAYSFWSDGTDPADDAAGYKLVIAELYESPIANDRGPLGSATNYSSIRGGGGGGSGSPAAAEILNDPHVLTKSFIIAEPISHMSVTQTRQGITSRALLCVLPESNAIVAVPRAVLDPRRPVDRDATTAEATEEGLFRYMPVLELDGTWFITHSRDVAGVRAVVSSPTLLESSSLVFAYGGDVFATRVAPSLAFDILGKGFSKIQLVLTVLALAAGVFVLAPMVRKKQVDLLWKTT